MNSLNPMDVAGFRSALQAKPLSMIAFLHNQRTSCNLPTRQIHRDDPESPEALDIIIPRPYKSEIPKQR